MWACRNGHKDTVQLLLNCSDKKIELNIRDDLGQTAFMFACFNGNKDVVQLLLNCSDKDFENTRDNMGWTAFMWACFYGHKDIVEFLLNCSDRNTQLETRTNNGHTALSLARFKRHSDVVKLLLANDNLADPEALEEAQDLSVIVEEETIQQELRNKNGTFQGIF